MSEKEYTPKNILSLIVFGAIVIFSLALVTGCDEPSHQERFEASTIRIGTPSGATNIEFIDGQWYTFEWRGQCFLAMKYWRHASMTRIDCKD